MFVCPIVLCFCGLVRRWSLPSLSFSFTLCHVCLSLRADFGLDVAPLGVDGSGESGRNTAISHDNHALDSVNTEGLSGPARVDRGS